MKVSKQVNWLWEEFTKRKTDDTTKPMFGKWQWIYENDNGKVAVQEIIGWGINGTSVFQVQPMNEDMKISELVLPTQKMAQDTAYEMLGEKIETN